MNRYEAREIIEKVHALANIYVNRVVTERAEPFLRELGVGRFTAEAGAEPVLLDDEDRAKVLEELLHLEQRGQTLLGSSIADFRIIRSDGTGPASDPKAIAYNTLAQVASIDVRVAEKVVEQDGQFYKVPARSYIAWGEPYTAPDGRTVRDSCSSGPEGFVLIDGGWRQYGAASALVARLLEARAAGEV